MAARTTKDEVLRWADRWEAVNHVTAEEERGRTYGERLRDLDMLFASRNILASAEDEAGVEEVRSRWLRLKELACAR